ncbi:hypothetical protein RB653_002168 [Dictyostelium firmibasis]|uniref:Methylated-DNA--protein-cysteine methyltransferase n=1 Tax=Dictyostelium firmibasis TaxID=79012 RepID=A0AAN7TX02_9MYCE
MSDKIRKSIENEESVKSDNKKLKIEKEIEIDSFIMKSPIGALKITADEKSLHGIRLYDSKNLDEECKNKTTNKIILQINEELDQYFIGKLKEFKTPISLEQGTVFQRKVWEHLRTIPYGSTLSYASVAIQLGLEKKFARAIATSCRLNIFLLIVPCHRVISSAGKVIGYSGKKGIDKQFILSNIEKANV